MSKDLLIMVRFNLPVLSTSSNLLLQCFHSDSRSEKIARGVLFAALQRELGPDKIVILDAPNYIKGFRYQLHCAAREMRIRTTTVCMLTLQHYILS